MHIINYITYIRSPRGRVAVFIKVGITVTFVSHLAGPIWAPLISFAGNCAWLWISFGDEAKQGVKDGVDMIEKEIEKIE